MSTIFLIVLGLIGGVILLVVIGYLLEKAGVIDKLKDVYASLKSNFPTYKRWLITGGIAAALLLILVIILIIIF